jgi:predicted RNA-binding protein with PUA-like domain
MNHWLVKTEPGTYSWQDLCRDGRTSWDGVRNFQARNHIRAMRPGDLALVYHSVSDKCVVGVARVVSEPYPDRSAKAGDWTAVDVEPAFALREPVSLDRIRADRALANMVLLKQSRLSVQPVKKAEFDRIVSLGGKGK